MNADTFAAMRERMPTRHLMYKGCTDQRKYNLHVAHRITLLVSLYLPPERRVSHVFLQQILTGKKQALERRHVTESRVPSYPELSIEVLWKMVQDDEALLEHLPDGPPKPKAFEKERKYKCDKGFLWHIIATLRPDMTASLEA